VRALDHALGAADAVVAARHLMAVPERERVVGEIDRLLRSGGRCFVAEPRSTWGTFWTRLAHWLWALPGGIRELRGLSFLSPEQFGAAAESQPRQQVSIWHDSRYQYAVCQKRGRDERQNQRKGCGGRPRS
jgi:hypothetical protein